MMIKMKNIIKFNIGEIISFYEIYSSIYNYLKIKNSRNNTRKISSLNIFKNILKQHNCDNVDNNNTNESKNEESFNNIEKKSYDYFLNEKNL